MRRGRCRVSSRLGSARRGGGGLRRAYPSRRTIRRHPECLRRQSSAWDRSHAAAPLRGGAGGVCRSARAVHGIGRTGHRRRDWLRTGMAYQKTGQPEAAEDAYRKSLAIKVRLGNVAGQATTLGRLGNLYDDDLDRTEEAVAFSATRRTSMSNSAMQRMKGGTEQCRRYSAKAPPPGRSAARKSTGRSSAKRASATRLASWTSWTVLTSHRKDAGNPTAAAEAKGKRHRLLPRLPPR